MKILKMKEFYEVISSFIFRHCDDAEVRVITEDIRDRGEYLGYRKEYLFPDASGMEINRIVYETVEVEVKGIKTKVDVKLLETEWCDTDSKGSIYMYQRY